MSLNKNLKSYSPFLHASLILLTWWLRILTDYICIIDQVLMEVMLLKIVTMLWKVFLQWAFRKKWDLVLPCLVVHLDWVTHVVYTFWKVRDYQGRSENLKSAREKWRKSWKMLYIFTSRGQILILFVNAKDYCTNINTY